MSRTAKDAPLPRVLVVDDDRHQAEMLGNVLRLEGFDVACCHSGADALAVLGQGPMDAVVSDYRMPGMSGLELLRAVQASGHRPVFIIITAFGTMETAVEAMREGAHDFTTKPVDISVLTLRLRKALQVRDLESENEALRTAVDSLREKVRIIGDSPRMRAVLETVAQVSQSHATVLIRGESGTGKEMVARAIHLQSPRHVGPYVKVNCAAIPDTLLEDELFGHARGAFTGAIADRRGRFETASGGTLFLDEIGDLPLALQPKLLRVLQEREVEPVGSGRTIKVDVRLLAATHRDLRAMVAEGRFREDLFYRLNVIPIVLPALRERREDVLPLARHFLRRFCDENARRIGGFTRAAEERLATYSWPGNVRELENCVERAVVLATRDVLDADDVLPGNPASADGPAVRRIVDGLFESGIGLDGLEKEIILAALEACGGNLSRTARRLGMTRRSLQYRVEKIREGAAGPEAGGEPPEPEEP